MGDDRGGGGGRGEGSSISCRVYLPFFCPGGEGGEEREGVREGGKGMRGGGVVMYCFIYL